MKKIDETIDRDEKGISKHLLEETKILNSHLLGKRITEVRWLTKEEAEECGWTYQPIQITLSNGIILVPMADDEGNDGGALFTGWKEESLAPVLSIGD